MSAYYSTWNDQSRKSRDKEKRRVDHFESTEGF